MKLLFLIGAPLAAVVARALMTPAYQDDADQPDTPRYLTELAEAATRNDAAAMIALLGAVLYVGAALALGSILRSHLGRIAAALSVVGAFGLAAWSIQVLLAGVLAEQPDREAMIALLDKLNTASEFSVFYLAMIAGALGSLLFGFALYRSRAVPRAAALITGLGGATLMLTAPGPLVVFVVGGAALALIGFTWTALSAVDAVEEIPTEPVRIRHAR
ncbi:uncharacterized protein DUF4386 [Kribbella sp. VKM Ac-2527]|uniref:Uncharacterized protein DUF4386 n=1 Tax=Kribbella caucasensis TaxID=2512215 RepID=A0A4R6KQX4_9ACTN|nr:DUF4386 family protein [Kribbella sp. VKM Ac-2527]TDO52249.1 uncharacterized protein DUF4386 [Kribbella sp. VKM Ac-2527]